MNPERWNDDRLDDLAALVHTNDGRLDTMVGIVSAHDTDLKMLAKRGDRRSDRQFQIWLVVISCVLTNIIVIVGVFFK